MQGAARLPRHQVLTQRKAKPNSPAYKVVMQLPFILGAPTHDRY